jgi:hypothetical protein
LHILLISLYHLLAKGVPVAGVLKAMKKVRRRPIMVNPADHFGAWHRSGSFSAGWRQMGAWKMVA